ncbi:type II toxin-antitoxin system PemK/MazF family toxin [Parapedobacter soli]|uniref:type II toxin-antitoxin system PemK/MazF family toxin n=1 Tax=Parapedobacter soli TaxID=416955 RepID=UPI0021C9277C|nr:type II toxin-antitoxin system PemK/MazF family toxin [Parapedobacter soli]
MAKFIKGDIVVIPFPFSDLSGSKRRPAYVLTDLGGDDIILCQITSQIRDDEFSINLGASDFREGSLPVASRIRPTRIFTADKRIIARKAGTVNEDVKKRVSAMLRQLFD